MEEIPYPLRINRYLALKGFSTRRGADTLIEAKKVKINGRTAMLGDIVNKKDTVAVDTEEPPEYSYAAYYKPREILTHSAKKGQRDISMLVGDKKLSPIGRLDKDSEGLIILTNDGRVTDRLLNPKYEHEKEYEVTLDKQILRGFEDKMEKGVIIEGYRTKKCKVKVLGAKKFIITLIEGKKHQIRRMCAALGYQVQNLKRIRVMNIELGKLMPNESRTFSEKEKEDFLHSLALQ